MAEGVGKVQAFPEIDRVGWFTVAEARVKLLKGHVPFLDKLLSHPALADANEGVATKSAESSQETLFK